MHKKYIEGLKKCLISKDVEKLFRDAKLENISKTPFFEKSILLMRNGRRIGPSRIEVEGDIELSLRVYMFLRFGGFWGTVPMGAGESFYFGSLHSALKEMSQIKKIKGMSDIDGDLIDSYIETMRGKGVQAPTIGRKISALFEYLKYPEVDMPSFLVPDENALLSSKLYADLREEIRFLDANRTLVATEEKVYPLEELKIMMQHSINAIENYAEEIIFVARAIYDGHDLPYSKRYSTYFDLFYSTDREFEEPGLKSIQEDTRMAYGVKFYSAHGGAPNVKAMIKRMLHAINSFEASCVSVALFMTGMRGGELTTLDRRMKFSKDEHWHLERLIYKTAKDNKGEALTMPIPTICKKALEALSSIAKIKDGKESGNLVLSSAFSSEVGEIGTDRLNTMLESYCDKLSVKRITSHQFRHTMAFLIVRINENSGLELAKMFLGHTSETMTLQYMGQYNRELREALQELGEMESVELVDEICDEISGGRRLFGSAGKKLAPNYVFTGEQAGSYAKLLRKCQRRS